MSDSDELRTDSDEAHKSIESFTAELHEARSLRKKANTQNQAESAAGIVQEKPATPVGKPSEIEQPAPPNNFEEDTSTESALAAVRLRREEAQVENQEQNLKLRKAIARWAMCAVSVQLAVSAAAFFTYLIANLDSADSSVIITWLGATVVEVVGIAAVVTRNLFPPRTTNDENGDID